MLVIANIFGKPITGVEYSADTKILLVISGKVFRGKQYALWTTWFKMKHTDNYSNIWFEYVNTRGGIEL